MLSQQQRGPKTDHLQPAQALDKVNCISAKIEYRKKLWEVRKQLNFANDERFGIKEIKKARLEALNELKLHDSGKEQYPCKVKARFSFDENEREVFIPEDRSVAILEAREIAQEPSSVKP